MGVLIWDSASSAQMPIFSNLLATCLLGVKFSVEMQWANVVGIVHRRVRELKNGQAFRSHIFNLLVEAKFRKTVK